LHLEVAKVEHNGLEVGMLNKTKSVLEVNIHDTNIFVGEFSIFKSCDDYLKLSSYVTHRSKALLGVK
jgi:hypothetical protein